MVNLADINSSPPSLPVWRLLGKETQILSRRLYPIGQTIRAEWMEIQLPSDGFSDSHGLLHVLPIEDDRFCVHLLYLQVDKVSSDARVFWLEFQPSFFQQFPLELIEEEKSLNADRMREIQFAICSKSSHLLSQFSLEESAPTSFSSVLRQMEAASQLLRRALECIKVPFTACPVPACRFLANESEREKIHLARTLIESHLDQPMTIKELARKVAMNECYLKKGFKAMTGKTLHEYQQTLRIAKARELLETQELSVSEVAHTLGYSSISHFSTAFKKFTGLKPRELLR